MLLTITNTKSPATDLGATCRCTRAARTRPDFSFGKAHVFYSEAIAETLNRFASVGC
jgi:hypothetical protein